MMKKLLLLTAVLFTTASFAQFANVGFLGFGTTGSWGYDIDMATTDGVVYTLESVTIAAVAEDPGVKFRLDDDWAVVWGGTGWPSGTASLSAGNIPSVPGLYDITFNINTLAYSFVEAEAFDTITIVAGGTSFATNTLDGIHYTTDNFTVANATTLTFNNGGVSWGGAGFPSGTATAGGTAISVPANSYNITFNNETGAYEFNYVAISITGDAVGGWGTDVDFTTVDGINYTLTDHTFGAGEFKWRLNHGWDVLWGNATFPSGTASIVGNGGNIAIPAGTYDVTFNRVTGAFNFTESVAGTMEFSSGSIVAYPNPSANAWNFNAGDKTINSILIADLTGKIIYNSTANLQETTVDASNLAAGIYFAKVTAGHTAQIIRLVKN